MHFLQNTVDSAFLLESLRRLFLSYLPRKKLQQWRALHDDN